MEELVKLYHPDRFAHEPDKLETYHKLTAAINRAKDAGDIQTLREIAEDPQAFILRQGWANLVFSDEAGRIETPHPGPLPIRCGEGEKGLYETLELEIITVLAP